MDSISQDTGVQKKTNKTDNHNSFFILIIVGLAAGIISGLFFGEYCSPLKILGDAFIGLLQMTVLPYIVLSLILSVGRLTTEQARILAVRGIYLLLILWGLGVLMVILMSASFPKWQSGSFFSTSFLQQSEKTNILDLYIPSNPFHSLANNFVPAVVIFSMGMGIALINLKNKEKFLEQLDIAVRALKSLNVFVIKLTPVGVFFITASQLGTMSFKQLELVQVYLIVLTVGAIMLTIVILPMMIAAISSSSWKEVLHSAKDAIILAFATGNVFVVLPMIVDSANELTQNCSSGEEGQCNEISGRLIAPLAFPFPDLGRIWGLIFIPFASWFYGSNLKLIKYPIFLSVGIISSFGSLNNSVPFLLRLMKIPSDIFNLFVAFGFYTTRLNMALKTMFLLAFTVILISWLSGSLKIHWKSLLKSAASIILIMGIIIVLLRGLFTYTFTKEYSKDKLIKDRPPIGPKVDETVLKESGPNPVKIKPGESIPGRIKRRGILRVGFDPNELPFTYFNTGGQLVGFDVDMAHQMAEDLGVKLEFVPFRRETLVTQLEEDNFDIAMSGIQGTINRTSKLLNPAPYLKVTLSLVVPDSERDCFTDLSDINSKHDLTFAVVRNGFFAEKASEYFPNAKIVQIESEKEFFDNKGMGLSGMITSAESGSAWTLIFPEFAVTNPFEGKVRVPLFYLIGNDHEFKNFLESWQDITLNDGTAKKYYNYWILGQDMEVKKPRWCVLRDILHWVK